MSASAMLHVRIDEDLKSKATAALDAMGLSASDAVRMLFKRIVAEQAFPLELKVPNDETIAAMEESREIMREMRRSGQSRFANAEEMFAELEKAGGR
jgi:DNA-damage-inducible protein J